MSFPSLKDQQPPLHPTHVKIAATTMNWMTNPAILFLSTPHMLKMESTRMKSMHDYYLSINCCFNLFLLIGHVEPLSKV